MNDYKKLRHYIRPYWPRILLAACCTALVTGCTLLIAPLAGLAFKAIGDKNFFLLNLCAGGIIGLYFIKGLFSYGQDYLANFVALRLVSDLRLQFYRHLEELSLDFYSRWKTGEVVSRLLSDMTLLQVSLSTTLTTIIPQTILLLGLIIYIFYLNWRLSLLTLIALPLIVQAIRLFGIELRRISESAQQKTADLTSHVQETVSQIRVVKAFTMEKAEAARFAAVNDKTFHFTMWVAQVMATQNPVVAFLQSIAAVGIVWFGGREIIIGSLTLPQLVSFATALGILTDPGSMLSRSYSQLAQGSASAKRIFEILDTKPSIIDYNNAKSIKEAKGEIEFKAVSFAYEKWPVLKQIDLRIKPGEVIALVGRTGAGKSTLVNLIPRFYDPTQGQVLLDGQDLRSLTVESLRKQIAIVPQEIALFHGTIRDNIAYGKPEAADSEVIAAAQSANAHKFIASLPDGYATEVGERGLKLSGGERQRLAIARAILRNPKILILDEATSSLDAETEALIREALEKLMQGRTTFIIAHRLYTIEKADRVIVLDQGQILETGRHQELLERGGLYKHLYELQLQNKI